MKFYADAPARRSRQLVVDGLVLVWILIAVWAGVSISHQFDDLAEQVRKSDTAGSKLAGNLTDAGDFLNATPLVGDEIRAPFDSASDASQGLADAGGRSADSVESTGNWVGTVTAIILILIVMPYYLPARIRFIVTATIAARLMRVSPDPDLWALRALTRRPVRLLHSRVPDAARGWREGDPDVIEALAALELESCGIVRAKV